MFFLFLIIIINTKDLCYLRLDDINVNKFFSDILLKHSINKTLPYKIFGTNKGNFDKRFDDCDIFNNDTSIKIVFGKNASKIAEFLKIFNVKEMRFFTEFLDLIKNKEKIKVKDFWDFWLSTYFYPKKYDKPNLEIPSFDLTINNTANNTENKLPHKVISVVSNFLGMNREYNSSKRLIINRNSSNNIFVTISKNAYKLRTNNFSNEGIDPIGYYTSNILVSTSSFLKSVTKSFSELFGIYDKDEEGRKPFRFLKDFTYPFLNEISKNKTYSRFVSKSVENFSKGVMTNLQKIKKIRLNALIIFVVNKIREDFRWTNIKNDLYNTFLGKQSKYALKMIYNILKNPEVRSLKFPDFVFNTPKMIKIEKHLIFMKYVFGQHNLHKSTVIRHTNFFNYIPYNDDFVEYSSNSTYKRFMNVQYYEGQKDYNLPEYGSGERWILSIFDVFDLRFWDPGDSWFTGFHPDDRRKLRPLGLTILVPTPIAPLFLPVLVPSDFFSLIGWVWEYALRSNITITLLPFLEEYYEAPNEAMCLPAPFKVPEPLYGCAPPVFEAAPPNFHQKITQICS